MKIFKSVLNISDPYLMERILRGNVFYIYIYILYIMYIYYTLYIDTLYIDIRIYNHNNQLI